MERIPTEILATLRDDTNREIPVGLHCGSLMGRVRDLLGVEQMSYLTVDDPRSSRGDYRHDGQPLL